MEFISEIWNFIKELINPESIIHYGGFGLLLFVVYSETGLFVGFFLPGDSLLFTAGLFTATGLIDLPVLVVSMSICFAAIAGNSTGYLFGRRAGKAIFKREKSFFFKPSHLKHAKEFYDKHGGKAIVLGVFLPIIRTFAPIVAGAVELKFKKFIFYSISGAMLWSNSLVLTAYFLGKNIPGIKDYLHYIIISLVVITSVPFLIAIFKNWKSKKSR